jgi:hypothetical protein
VGECVGVIQDGVKRNMVKEKIMKANGMKRSIYSALYDINTDPG